MANARRELQYDIAIQTIVFFCQAWNKEFKPASSNPFRNLDSIKTMEQKKQEEKEGWYLLKAGLTIASKGRKG